MVISYNIKVALLVLSFSLGAFLTLSQSRRLCRQMKDKNTSKKRTAALLGVGIAFVILFAALYKNWLYSAAFYSWPIGELENLIGGGLLACGVIYIAVGIGSSLQDHLPMRKNTYALALSLTGVGLLILGAILFLRLLLVDTPALDVYGTSGPSWIINIQ